jgi:hypothetical protein
LNVTLQPVNRYALKEWAIMVQALSSGRQTLLFRKGGMIEEQGEFSVEQAEFFLYPTYLHEQVERIVPDAAKDLEAVLQAQPLEERVVLSIYGAVHEAIVVNDFERVEALRSYHILSPDEVKRRFYYRDREGFYVLLLCAYHVPNPFELTVTPDYAGCKSWVDLQVELSTVGCRPVLSDESFSEQIQAIRSILK